MAHYTHILELDANLFDELKKDGAFAIADKKLIIDLTKVNVIRRSRSESTIIQNETERLLALAAIKERLLPASQEDYLRIRSELVQELGLTANQIGAHVQHLRAQERASRFRRVT